MKHKGEEDTLNIRRILAGDPRAFEVLVRKYEAEVHRIVAHKVPYDDVAEVAHEVFIRVYKSLAGFRQEGSFRRWITTIAMRTCHDFWRDRYRNERTVRYVANEFRHPAQGRDRCGRSDQVPRAPDAVARAEDRNLLNRAFAHLGATDRMILLLRYFDGYSAKETANLLGLSVANVKVRSFRARKKLRGILKAFFEQGE